MDKEDGGVVLKFILSFIPPVLVAGIGAVVTTPAIAGWYTTLHKPVFTPPNWIFGPVWTLLFFFMAVSWYVVWTSRNQKAIRVAAEYFFLQLGLNLIWSMLFFGAHAPLAAFIDIIALWIAIFVTIKKFFVVSRIAAYLLIPYLLWVSFAAFLNLSIVLLN